MEVTQPGVSPKMEQMNAHEVRAPRGSELSCRSWPQEAAMRMLMNNLDPEVAERPEDLVVYGGTGRAARSWDAYDAIVRIAEGPRRRRDAPGPVREAGRGLPHPRDGAARPDLERDARAEVGRLGDLPGARGRRSHDVRADDRRLVDLHRDAGDPAGDLRNARRVRDAAVRRDPGRHDHAHRRARGDGRSPAAGRHDERRRRDLRRGRPGEHRAAHQDRVPRSRDRRRRARLSAGPRSRSPAASRSRSDCWGTARTWSRRCSLAASVPTS